MVTNEPQEQTAERRAWGVVQDAARAVSIAYYWSKAVVSSPRGAPRLSGPDQSEEHPL